MAEMIVVKSKIKEAVKNLNVAGDLANALNEVAVKYVKEAEKRAKANGRKTVQARDLCVESCGKNDAQLVVKSKVKEVVKDCNVSSDFSGSLNCVLNCEVSMAAKRAEANGRKTVQARDL